MSGGARVRGGTRSRPAPGGGRGLALALLPVVAAGLVVVAGLGPAAPDSTEAPRPAPARETTYACTGAPDLATGQVDAGSSTSARALPGGADVDGATDPRSWVRSELDDALGDDADALVVTQRGTGSGAVGFVSGTLAEDQGEGLVVGRCPGVVDDAWYAGLGSGQRHLSDLVLTNLADTPAVVDVSLWSADGPVDAVGGDGLVVEPGDTRTVPLADLAAGEPDLGVHVARRRGAVAVSVLDTSTGASQGSELVSPAPEPARRLVVAGLPAGERGRTLHVLNPSASTARVAVEVLGSDGAFVPEGLGEVKVGAGRVVSVDVPRSAGSGRVALRLVADTPVVATASVSPTGDDTSTTEAVGPWTGPAVVPVKGGLGVPELVLSAPGADADRRVVLEARDADLEVVSRAEVAVPAGTTVGVDPDDELDLDGATSLVVRSTGGVVGAAQFRDGDRRASLALTAAPTDVLAPRVRPAP